jgi:hypothetical protein
MGAPSFPPSSLRTQGPITTGVQTPLSSPGLTGRPSTPRPLDLISGFPAYWIPAFAGMTSGGRDDELWNGH